MNISQWEGNTHKRNILGVNILLYFAFEILRKTDFAVDSFQG